MVGQAEPIARGVKLSRQQWAMIAAAIAVLLVALLLWWNSRSDTPLLKSAPDAAQLKRLPARPEDIEAHGADAATVLPTDDARRKNDETPFVTGKLSVARPFRFKGSDEDRARALRCLATAVLYEAGDDTDGEAAVAQVVLNRVRHAAFPATICGVVYQGSQRATGCQFTFTCDGSLRRQMSDAAWGRARAVAERALSGNVYSKVGLATHYHTDWVYPYWSPELNKLARVGTHLFFGWPGGWGGPRAFLRTYTGNEQAIATPAPTVAMTMPSPEIAGELGGLPPRLQGLPLAPAKLPAGMGKVPLYGNKLKLVRPDGRAFGLLAPPGTPASKLVSAALALCAQPGFCQVSAWGNEDDIPAEYPIPFGASGTMVFEFLRDDGTGKSTTRFNCAVYPNKDPKACL